MLVIGSATNSIVEIIPSAGGTNTRDLEPTWELSTANCSKLCQIKFLFRSQPQLFLEVPVAGSVLGIGICTGTAAAAAAAAKKK